MSPSLEQHFPSLTPSGYAITSPKDRRYNCVAWAVGDQKRWWWPDPAECGYWPDGVSRELTEAAFIAAFGTLGFVTCEASDLEPSMDKVVLYTANGRVTHAARQLGDGSWTSKCGSAEDIQHTLAGLAGDLYGQPTIFMARPRIERST